MLRPRTSPLKITIAQMAIAAATAMTIHWTGKFDISHPKRSAPFHANGRPPRMRQDVPLFVATE
jgi:hypothetical protein